MNIDQDKPKRSTVFSVLVVFVSCFSFLVATVLLDHPTLKHDEIWFMHMPMGFPMGDIYNMPRPFGLTVFLYAYVGALKSYLYMPIVEQFGFSVWTVRIPIAILIFVTASMGWWGFSRLSMRLAGMLFFALFLSLPESSFLIENDFGFVSFHNFVAVVMSLTSVCIILDKPSANKLKLMAFVLMSAALFSHLKFIWTINAVIFSTFVVLILQRYRCDENVSLFKSTFTVVFEHRAYFIGFLVLALWFVFQTLYFRNHQGLQHALNLGSDLTFFQALLITLKRMLLFLSGGLTLTDSGLPLPMLGALLGFLFLSVLFVALLIGIRTMFRMLQRDQISAIELIVLFLMIWLVAVVAQLLVTRQASARWHVQTILVPSCLLISVVIQHFFFTYGNHLRWFQSVVAAVIVGLAYQVVVAQIETGKDSSKRSWDLMSTNPPAINELLAKVQSTGTESVWVLGWGVAPMLAFEDTSIKFVWDGRPLDGTVARDWLARAADGTIFIVPTEVTQTDAARNDELLTRWCVQLHVTSIVSDSNGRSVYRIGVIEPIWNEAAYLNFNPDVKKAVEEKSLSSGFFHWQKFGVREYRNYCESR